MAHPTRPSRGVLVAAISVVALLSIAAVSLAVRSRSGSEPGIEARTPDDPQLVYAEFGTSEDRIYLAQPSQPDARTLIDSVRHAPGWGINPAIEVAGSRLAYTVLPENARPQRDSPAELWVMDIESRNKTRLARDADLLVPPVFLDEGERLVYRRSNGSRQELVTVEIDDMTRTAVHAEDTAFGIFPVGDDHEGDLLFARLSPTGTDLYRVGDAEPELLAHLSDDIAREWQVSPDGNALSYLAPEVLAERVAYRAHVLSLRDVSPRDLPVASESGEQYGPIWTPNGAGVTVGQEVIATDSEPAIVLATDGQVTPLPPPTQGFDVPLGWSGNGRFLAVRSFNGRNAMEPGAESTVIIDTEGQRYPVEVSTEVIYIGWYSGV